MLLETLPSPPNLLAPKDRSNGHPNNPKKLHKHRPGSTHHSSSSPKLQLPLPTLPPRRTWVRFSLLLPGDQPQAERSFCVRYCGILQLNATEDTTTLPASPFKFQQAHNTEEETLTAETEKFGERITEGDPLREFEGECREIRSLPLLFRKYSNLLVHSVRRRVPRDMFFTTVV